MVKGMFNRIYVMLSGFWNWLLGYTPAPEVEFITVRKPIKRFKMINPRDAKPPLKRRRTAVMQWDGIEDIEPLKWKTQHYL